MTDELLVNCWRIRQINVSNNWVAGTGLRSLPWNCTPSTDTTPIQWTRHNCRGCGVAIDDWNSFAGDILCQNRHETFRDLQGRRFRLNFAIARNVFAIPMKFRFLVQLICRYEFCSDFRSSIENKKYLWILQTNRTIDSFLSPKIVPTASEVGNAFQRRFGMLGQGTRRKRLNRAKCSVESYDILHNDSKLANRDEFESTMASITWCSATRGTIPVVWGPSLS